MTIRTAVTLFAALFLLVSCVGAGGNASRSTGGTDTVATDDVGSFDVAPTPPEAPPIDPAIVPVSASSPSPQAANALKLCRAYDLGLDHVAGMGLLVHGTDAPRFGLSAAAPQLKTDAPVWAIQFRGDFPQPQVGQSWIDAMCVVVDGEQGFYSVGPIRDLATGKIVRGYWPERGSASLPPLGP